ncbi:RagB/SusD family nutrient uptake outer membrane protein [Phocaeicola barnesiae]|uniref:RagB/SusD family nutrient uptake outer membrane protein n=1 Tax=Phocaeicola barnesiae TaxID=376804 RepID=UPI0025A3D501|nr:RagB/SusD family nutrient uptake outer membrane protein [Phocaeicola barnesiae]MDM8233555.1 RagB/SusD family nutrient uptake outer membrane protein [Phocaeicola barnesiae]
MKKKHIFVSLMLGLLMGSCSLDYENTNTITPEGVWENKDMISAFLTNIYGSMLPGWPISANGTDEGMDHPTSMSQYVRGEITVDNTGQGLDYKNIDKINYFLANLESVTVLNEDEKKQLRGQALFWRAWDYWGKVFTLGGVPLILQPQDVSDLNSLLVARSSTSECVKQILADLDEAIASLPDKWENEDYGRIDKGCAMAFKGRMLLQYASPLFNPNNDQQRWQDAYDANKAAVDFLKSVGKGLYEGDFADIWFDERNKEVIMVNQYYYPDHALSQNAIRPMPLTRDMADLNQAILPLVMAFPKIDGTPLQLDLDKLATDKEYNQQFLTDFYTNRDPRFHATVFCPGMRYPCGADLSNGKKYWNAWRKEGTSNITLIQDEMNVGASSGANFYQMKGVDDLESLYVYQGETDWIEIRFAEVLMNMGEAANEIGKSDEALQVLYDIRKRAGIRSSDGKYGITATSQDEIREAYVNERFIEFAYEGKRWNDLRRWKRFDILNNLKYRSTLYPILEDYSIVQNGQFDWTKDMLDPDVRKLFHFEYIECVDGDKNIYRFNLDLNHWFYPIKKDDLDRNSKLEQNNEWGGTFDPLK